MPIYSYRCEKCGETFDKLVKPGDNGSDPCIHCQSSTRRVFSPAGIIFKGSGFYSTDYKSGGIKADKGTAKTGQDKKEVEHKSKPDTGTGEKTAEKAKSVK